MDEKEFHKQFSSKGGKKGGVNRWKNTTPEQRKAFALLGVEARKNKTALDKKKSDGTLDKS